jgi:hypothetical protein
MQRSRWYGFDGRRRDTDALTNGGRLTDAVADPVAIAIAIAVIGPFRDRPGAVGPLVHHDGRRGGAELHRDGSRLQRNVHGQHRGERHDELVQRDRDGLARQRQRHVQRDARRGGPLPVHRQ